MPKNRASCKVCAHPSIRKINQRLADPSNSARSVALEYKIEPRTMQRHYSGCIAKVVESILAQNAETPGNIVPPAAGQLQPLTQDELAIGADIVYRVQHLQAKTLKLLNSIPEGKVTAACAVIREARQNYALIARLTGKLNGGGEEGSRTVTFEQLTVIYNQVVNQKEAA